MLGAETVPENDDSTKPNDGSLPTKEYTVQIVGLLLPIQ